MSSATLLIHCPDHKGIILSVTEFIYKNKGNVIDLDQHVDSERHIFFMRIEWHLDDFIIPRDKIGEYFDTLVANEFQMRWTLHFSDEKQRMALMVSKMDHCFNDILSRYQSGEWQVEIPFIISNHPDMQATADRFNIPFHYLPITKENKKEQEQKQLDLLRENNVDFVVLARYMQILSADFVDHFPNRIINIHHSFLPAFPGAKPYHSAHARGVKIIGATSHYVTSDLDEGAIIVQNISHVSHNDTVADLVRKGRDIEKIVLSDAIWHHANRRVLVYGNKTVVFN